MTGMIRIIIVSFQVLSIVTKMQSTETAQGDANRLQNMLDQLSYFLTPASWLTDVQCLKLGWTPQETLIK